MSVLFLIKNKDGVDIRIIPGLAAMLLSLASFGPWGAQGAPNIYQEGLLKKHLIQADMLGEDGFLKPISPKGMDRQ